MNRLIILFATIILTSVPLFCKNNERHALVIGNDSYVHAHALLNARNDAKDVADAFKTLGYSVMIALDANRERLDQAITLFAQSLNPGDIAVIYYSGHGFQAEGDNYLVPIDFAADTEAAGRQQSRSLSSVLQSVSSRGTRIQVVLLDACRDNPFFPTRSAIAGWAQMGAAAGTVIAFGTSPGSTASDNPTGRNGLFTKQLLSRISSAEPIEDLLKQVAKDTIVESLGAQRPWIASSLIGDFFINPQYEHSKIPQSELSLRDQLATPVDAIKLVDPRSILFPRSTTNQNPVDLKSAEILTKQGILLAQHGNYEEAVRSLSAALALHPGYSIPLRLLGLIFHLLGRGSEAAAQFSRAIGANPVDYLAYTYRCAELTSGDPTAAVRDCYAATAIAPQSLPAHILLSNALLSVGKTDAALREIATALTLDPNSAQSYAVRARIYRTLGQNQAADRDINSAVRLTMLQRQ